MHWLFLRYVSSSSSLFITYTPIFNYSLVTSYFQQGNTLKPTTSFIEEYPWIHTRHDARSPMLDVRFLTEGMNRTNGLRTSMILWTTSPTLTDSLTMWLVLRVIGDDNVILFSFIWSVFEFNRANKRLENRHVTFLRTFNWACVIFKFCKET